MVFGLFGRLFTRSKSSQPSSSAVAKKAAKSNELRGKSTPSKLSSSMPSLASSQKTSNSISTYKSSKSKSPSNKLMNPDRIDSESDNDTANFSQKSKSVSLTEPSRLSRQQLTETIVTPDPSRLTQSRNTGGYESSESSSEGKTSARVSQFMNTLEKKSIQEINRPLSTNTNLSEHSEKSNSLADKIRQNQENKSKKSSDQPVMTSTKKQIGSLSQDKSFGQFDPINTGYTINKSNTFSQTVTFKEPESTLIDSGLNMSRISNVVSTEAIQRLATSISLEKTDQTKLNEENKQLEKKIEELQTRILEDKSKHKMEIDKLMAKFYDGTQNDEEKHELKMLFISEQQENNEKLINEQTRTIQLLKFKCKRLESELSKLNETINLKQIKELKEENLDLKNIVHRLNIELSIYQAKYPQIKYDSDSGFLNPHQVSQVNSKLISALIKEYDMRLSEKDEKINQLKNNIDEMNKEIKKILDENKIMHLKYDNIPENILNRVEKIKDVANLVLTENDALKEELKQKNKFLLDIKSNHVQEISRLSKKIIVSESERVNLQNQLDLYKENHDLILNKFNESSIEVQRRITLVEHLEKINQLRQQIEELNMKHKQELEKAIMSEQSAQNDKKDIHLKYTQLLSDNKKLLAENQVMEKALDQQIGPKIQKKMQNLQKKIELAELKEKIAYACLEKINKEAEKLKAEKEIYLNKAKENETETHTIERKLIEENVKNSKLEEKLNHFKEKAATKLASMIQKMQQKDAELVLAKLDSEKKLTKVISVVNAKQEEIENFMKEKKNIEHELENVWEKTSNENQKLKEILLDIKLNK